MINIADHLIGIIHHLRRAVANFVEAQARPPQPVWLGDRLFMPIVPPPRHPPIPPATWLLLHARLGRLAARVQSLFAHWQAGTIKPTRPAAPRQSSVTEPRPRAPNTRAPYTRLPAARGWINARIEAAAPCAGLLHAMLQRPGMPEFLAAVPRAGRLLRPLCHALAVDVPPALSLPPRPPKAPRPTRPRAPAPPPHRNPLPAYVRAAARAWKKFDR